MRLDKYLQVTGIIKRRAISNEACKLGLVCVNGNAAKPTREVSINDVIEIKLAKREVTLRVLKEVSGNSIKKSLRSEYFEILKDVSKKPDFDEVFWNEEDEADEN